MYEEPQSQSGLPSSCSLLKIVESEESFNVKANLAVLRWSGWGSFGMVKSFCAPAEGKRRKCSTTEASPDGGVGKRAMNISDNIAACLRESMELTPALERTIGKLFPQLNREWIYGGCTPDFYSDAKASGKELESAREADQPSHLSECPSCWSTLRQKWQFFDVDEWCL